MKAFLIDGSALSLLWLALLVAEHFVIAYRRMRAKESATIRTPRR
jgi:hypothetical protein